MDKQIAEEIWRQMRAMDANLCMCMGVQKLKIIERGLQFNVNGLVFKGIVQITLNGFDLYDVKFIKSVRKQNTTTKEFGIKSFTTVSEVEKEVNNVFVEDLMVVLEETVKKAKKIEEQVYSDTKPEYNKEYRSARIKELGLTLISGGRS